MSMRYQLKGVFGYEVSAKSSCGYEVSTKMVESVSSGYGKVLVASEFWL